MSACLCLFQLWEVRGVMAFSRTVVPEVLSSLSVGDRKVISCFCVFCSLPSQLPAVSTQRTRKLEDRRTRTGGSLCLPRGLGCTLTENRVLIVLCVRSRAGCRGTAAQLWGAKLGRRLQSPASQVWAPATGCSPSWVQGQMEVRAKNVVKRWLETSQSFLDRLHRKIWILEFYLIRERGRNRLKSG